jgi:DNA-binding beta-propeller fold protein YncE
VIVDTQIATDGLSVVLGARRYAVVSPWNRVPLGHISQLAVDRTGRVYAFQRTGSPIVVLGPEGDLVDSWGAGQISDPHGIFIDADDRVLLVDRDAHQVMIFDTDGKLRATLGERHRPRFGLPFNHPTDVAVAPSGEIYVCDGYGNAHVHCFSASGEHRFSWGGIGTGPGQFSTPHGIWVMADGRVLVADRENNRVQIFTSDGAYLCAWGDLYHPMDIYGDPDGTVFVTDQAPRIIAFSPQGEVLGRCKAAAIYSHGIWGDGGGNLFLCEHTGTVTKLARLP